MSIDAMKQALAALNDYEPNEAHKVATALRAAIEQAQPDELMIWKSRAMSAERIIEKFMQPEQEPVAFDHGIGSDRFKVVRGAFWWHVLIGDSPTEHGKFRSRAGAEKMAADLLREFRNGAFVQHTAPRQWQGLTAEEIKIIWRDIDGSEGMLMRFARAIEAKLKEKNT